MSVSSDPLRAWCRELTEQLADLLAHDYRNALYAATLQLEVLQQRLPASVRFEVREPLRALQEELARLQRRLELLLRAARPDPTPWCDAVTVLQDLAELARVVAQRRRLRLDLGALAAPPGRRVPVPAARLLFLGGLLAALEDANEQDSLGLTAEYDPPEWRIRWCVPRRRTDGRAPETRWARLSDLASHCGARLSWDGDADALYWVCTWPDPPSQPNDAHV